MIFYLDDPQNISTARAKNLAEKILHDAGLPWNCLAAACGGINGVDWPHEAEIHAQRLRDGLNLPDSIAVNDSIIALRAGTSAANRIILVAGTGLNIATHSANGAEYTYGYYIPNRLQGGAALGVAAIDAATEAEAGIRPATMLTNVILSASGCASIEAFLTQTTTRQKSFPPQSLVPGLLKSALAGDAAASRIIESFSCDMAAYIENAMTRLADDTADLVFSGGVFKSDGRHIAGLIAKKLSTKFPRLRFVNARLEPACGALLMLLDRRYNENIPPAVLKNFERGCEQHNLIRT
jgi:N-acetylglucosamine kinase-like BadF-type ATPase